MVLKLARLAFNNFTKIFCFELTFSKLRSIFLHMSDMNISMTSLWPRPGGKVAPSNPPSLSHSDPLKCQVVKIVEITLRLFMIYKIRA